jgi:Resolvase, N terminal domain
MASCRPVVRSLLHERSFARHSRGQRLHAGRGCNKTRVRANVTCTPVRDTFCGVRIGYARVSTRDQHPEAQADALTGAGCERIYTDKASGKLARRPELDEALRGLRAGTSWW